jgi:cytidylate kinase
MLNRPNLITVNGLPGAGKTTACKKLADELGWEYLYTGLMMRKVAEEMGVSITEIGVLEANDKSIAQRVDSIYVDLAKSDKPYIIDSRLAWHFLPTSFKVMFDVPVRIGAERVMGADKRTSESYRDIDSAMKSMQERRKANKLSYFNNYGIKDFEDFNNYDLVLDTAFSSPDRNVSFMRAAFSLWQKGIALPRVWMSPKSLVPTKSIMKLSDKAAADLQKNIEAHGFDTTTPVQCVKVEDTLYIADGHLRVSAAIRAGSDFIPITLTDDAKPKTKASAADIDAWENAHGFKFVA